MPTRYDWEELKHRYVTSDTLKLEDLAEGPNTPHIITIRKRAAEEGWTKQRRDHQEQIARKARELVALDVADVASRHAQIARALQGKALARLRVLDPMKMTPRDALAFLKEAADIERQALGFSGGDLSTIHGEFDRIADALASPVPPRRDVN